MMHSRNHSSLATLRNYRLHPKNDIQDRRQKVVVESASVFMSFTQQGMGIKGMLLAGMSQTRVVAHFLVNRATVQRLHNRYVQTGSTRDRPRPGQPRVTTQVQDRHIRVTHLRDRFRTATETAAETVGRHRPRISYRTVQRRPREHGIRPYRAHVGMVLTQPRRGGRAYAVGTASWKQKLAKC